MLEKREEREKLLLSEPRTCMSHDMPKILAELGKSNGPWGASGDAAIKYVLVLLAFSSLDIVFSDFKSELAPRQFSLSLDSAF